ncbi:MAG: hypothetical protein MZW92_57935 [Comamonadaceae bacterium]|nr:hypothetical protein [Comamonadaceae bacterium]
MRVQRRPDRRHRRPDAERDAAAAARACPARGGNVRSRARCSATQADSGRKKELVVLIQPDHHPQRRGLATAPPQALRRSMRCRASRGA